MPHSGPHYLRFWCDLVPKSSILGAPWRPAGPKMAPKIAQVAQNGIHCSSPRPLFWKPGTDLLPRSLSERSWAPFLRIFWQMLIPFSKICSIVRSAPGHNFFGFLMDFDSIFDDFFNSNSIPNQWQIHRKIEIKKSPRIEKNKALHHTWWTRRWKLGARCFGQRTLGVPAPTPWDAYFQ